MLSLDCRFALRAVGTTETRIVRCLTSLITVHLRYSASKEIPDFPTINQEPRHVNAEAFILSGEKFAGEITLLNGSTKIG